MVPRKVLLGALSFVFPALDCLVSPPRVDLRSVLIEELGPSSSSSSSSPTSSSLSSSSSSLSSYLTLVRRLVRDLVAAALPLVLGLARLRVVLEDAGVAFVPESRPDERLVALGGVGEGDLSSPSSSVSVAAVICRAAAWKGRRRAAVIPGGPPVLFAVGRRGGGGVASPLLFPLSSSSPSLECFLVLFLLVDGPADEIEAAAAARVVLAPA